MAHSDSRLGGTNGEIIYRGEYGSGTTDYFDNGRSYSVSHNARSTEYIATSAEARTLDHSMEAVARSEVDLARGTMRAEIEGYDTTLFPYSFREVSQARVDLYMRDTITYHLPAYFSGGTVQVSMLVDGAIVDERPSIIYNSGTQVVAQLDLGTASGNSETLRWSDEGIISDIITLDYELLPQGSQPFDQPLTFNAFLRLSSGTGDGSYMIDFNNTAILDMTVPEGVTWDSQSGVFLSAVPLPATAWLFVSALGVLVTVGRQRIST
ncbi:MAG: VPLPA-CTERM sorting domain-containing protein [Candidatus Thiodiazotropha sp.]